MQFSDVSLASDAKMDSADVSVVICAYTLERWEDLARAVGSASDQSVKPGEVIVVIDNNEELLAKAQAEFDQARVVRNHNGPGLSGGRNTGADVASGSVLLFLDDDAFASRDWLTEHLAGFDEPRVLGVGGDVNPVWRSGRPTWLPAEFFWVVGCTYTGMPTAPAPIRNPIGANMSIRAHVFRGAGGFQQELGRRDAGGRAITGTADETEFCIRALRHYPDGIWMYRPGASVGHVVPDKRATWRHFVQRCQLEGASKAVLVGLSGRQLGLASERRYIRQVLPRALLREIKSGIRGESEAFGRAAAIVSGVALTAFTFARARVSLAVGRRDRYVS